jgi:hypothetical protein
MSWLSDDLRHLTAWLDGIESPASKDATSSAATALSGGMGQVEKALELVAVDMANAGLALVPGGVGDMLAPVADKLIVKAATLMLARHSNPGDGALAVATSFDKPRDAMVIAAGQGEPSIADSIAEPAPNPNPSTADMEAL